MDKSKSSSNNFAKCDGKNREIVTIRHFSCNDNSNDFFFNGYNKYNGDVLLLKDNFFNSVNFFLFHETTVTSFSTEIYMCKSDR